MFKSNNHFFNVLDITPLQQLIELRKTLKMPIWDYNDKFYLKTNDITIQELPDEHTFQKDVPYIIDLTFQNTTLRRMVSRLLVIVFVRLIKLIKLL